MNNLTYALLAAMLLQGCSSQGKEAPEGNEADSRSKVTNNIVWHADFENQSLANWHYLLNPQGIAISNQNAASGDYAAHIVVQGTDDFLWHANPELNRSELQYQTSSVFEGGHTHLSFSFMLPKTLPNAKHEIAYWESNKSYQQIMRFTLYGDELTFSSTKEDAISEAMRIIPMTWYKVDMHIDWSVNDAKVKIIINDQRTLAQLSFATLINDKEQAFFQLGLLRTQRDAPASIWIDDVIEYAPHYQ